jgi:hypothetical protein
MLKPGTELDHGFLFASPLGTGFSPNEDGPSFFLRGRSRPGNGRCTRANVCGLDTGIGFGSSSFSVIESPDPATAHR